MEFSWQLFLLIVPVLSLGMMFVYAITLWLHRNKSPQDRSKTITICVAARNEEENIERCLSHLHQLDYPKEKLRILVGDDDSEDRTGEIVKEFIKDKPCFEYYHITEQLPGQRGKQNVLAQLFRKAQSELLLVTDADIAVPKTWAATLAGAIVEGVGMVSGTTVVEGKGLLARMQQLDWTFGMALNEAHTGLGIPLTGVGNNMAMTRKAYEQIGGYEALGFSITEDYQLFKEMCEKGPFDFRFVFRPDVLAFSAPVGDWKTLVQQRRRWFRGGQGIALHNRLLYLLNTLVMPSLILLLVFSPLKWFLVFYSLKIFADFFLLLPALLRLGKPGWVKYFFFYELYYQITALIWPVVTPFGKKVVWKGRTFED